MTFTDNGNGTAALGGTPTTPGTYPVTVTATNGFGAAATQQLTITVPAPAVASTPPTTESTTTTPAPKTGKSTIASPQVKKGKVSVQSGCQGASGSSCSVTVKLTARTTGKHAKTRELAHATFTLKAGARRSVNLTTPCSQKALKAKHLKTLMLTVVQTTNGKKQTLRNTKVTLPRR